MSKPNLLQKLAITGIAGMIGTIGIGTSPAQAGISWTINTWDVSERQDPTGNFPLWAIHSSIQVIIPLEEQLGQGPPQNGNPPPGGAHGIIEITETFVIDKDFPTFFGFVFPDFWPEDAWLMELLDPPETVTLKLTANTEKYGNDFIIDDTDDFLGFHFCFFAPYDLDENNNPIPDGIPIPYQTTWIGIDPDASSFGQLSFEDGFHPVEPRFTIPEPSTPLSLLALGTIGVALTLKRKFKQVGSI